MKFTPTQLATTLAALRYVQALPGGTHKLAHVSPLHFQQHLPLSVEEIDALCEALNSPDEPPLSAEIGAASDDTLTGKLVDALRHLVAEFNVGDPRCTEGLKALAQWEEESGS